MDASTPHGAMIEVGGEIRRIVILTVRFEGAAAFLARQLRSSGAELFILSQNSLKVEPGTYRYYRRLLSRRGIAVCLDCLLLDALKAAARSMQRVLSSFRSGGHGSDEGSPPDESRIFSSHDEGIRNEDWVRCIEVTNINGKKDRELLTGLKPDLVLLAGAPILSKKTIAVARVATLNPHCGITPAFAGNAPFFRAIYEKQFSEIGYTIHAVSPTVDGGPVIHQERVPWDPSRPTGHLWPLLARMMYEKLAWITRELVAGRRFRGEPQGKVRPNPPAGIFVRILTEWRRIRYAAQVRRQPGDRGD